MRLCISQNTTYTLQTYAFALQDIAPFGRNVVYTGNIVKQTLLKFMREYKYV